MGKINSKMLLKKKNFLSKYIITFKKFTEVMLLKFQSAKVKQIQDKNFKIIILFRKIDSLLEVQVSNKCVIMW